MTPIGAACHSVCMSDLSIIETAPKELRELATHDKAHNYFSQTTLRHLQEIPDEVARMDIDKLKDLGKLTLTDEQLRISMQREFASAMKANRPIRDHAVYGSNCPAAYYYNSFLKNPYKLAYAMMPLVRYENQMEAMLTTAVSRYNDLLNMDIMTKKLVTVLDEDGKPTKKMVDEVDPKKASILLMVIKAVEERTRGSVVQKSLNIIAKEPNQEDGDVVGIDGASVDAKIAELERKLNPYTVETTHVTK